MQRQTNHIYDLLEAELSSGKNNSENRRLLSLPLAEREYTRLCHQLLLSAHQPYQIADQLTVLEGQTADNAALLNARGCALAELCREEVEGSLRALFIEQASTCFRQSLALRPDYAVAWFNLAQLALKTKLPIAEEALEQTCLLLSNPPVKANQLIGPYYPGAWDAFRTELERVFGWFSPESSAWCEEIRRLILWLAYEQSSDLNAAREHWKAAHDFAEKAVEMRPDVFSSRLRLARALRNLGYFERAAVEYRHSLNDLPLNPEVWNELAINLIDLKRYDECHTFLEECQIMLRGCPVYSWWQEELNLLQVKLVECRTSLPKKLQLVASLSPDLHKCSAPSLPDSTPFR